MFKKTVAAITILYALFACCAIVHADENSAHRDDRLIRLAGKIEGGTIHTIEILWISPFANFRSTITPDQLDKLYFRKVAFRNRPGKIASAELSDALKGTVLSNVDSSVEGDVRWAIKFYEKNEATPTASIYL